jgi:hypothetical protein
LASAGLGRLGIFFPSGQRFGLPGAGASTKLIKCQYLSKIKRFQKRRGPCDLVQPMVRRFLMVINLSLFIDVTIG